MAFTYDTHELAWAAGFFDGEGCISSSGVSHGAIDIGQVRIEPLERFMAAVGMGKIYGPYSRKGEARQWNYQPIYKYKVTTFEKCQQTIILLWPWLSAPKREQAARELPGFPKPRRSVRTCRNGHVYAEVGRQPTGGCTKCFNDWQANRPPRVWKYRPPKLKTPVT